MEDVDPPQPGPRPDFRRLTQALQQAATEFSNLADFSPVAQAATIIEQMQQMQQQMQQNHQQTQQQIQQVQHQMQQMQHQMQQDMQQMQQQVQQDMQQMQHQVQQDMQQMQHQVQHDMQQLRTEIAMGHRVAEYNSLARLQNSSIGRSDAPLTALRELATNADVPNFPPTPAHISNMLGPALDRILTALNLPTNGTVADKKQRLRFHAGLKDIR